MTRDRATSPRNGSGTTPPSPPPPDRRRPRCLRTEQDCRRALAAWIADVEAGRLDRLRANSMFYGLSILIGSFRDERLDEIEQQLSELREAAEARP